MHERSKKRLHIWRFSRLDFFKLKKETYFGHCTLLHVKLNANCHCKFTHHEFKKYILDFQQHFLHAKHLAVHEWQKDKA